MSSSGSRAKTASATAEVLGAQVLDQAALKLFQLDPSTPPDLGGLQVCRN
jgi:hypothetical protein